MARYNSSLASNTITGTHTISSPDQGAFINLSGTAPYTVTLPNPTMHPGSNQTFYNLTGGIVTLTTSVGTFNGAGGTNTSSIAIPASNVVSVTSDGANYVVISEDGSPLIATTGLFSSDLTVNGAGATASFTPANITIAPTSSGTMNNVIIGGTTRAAGFFTSLAANSSVTLTANTSSSSTSTGTLVVTGGVGVSGTVTASSLVATSITGTIQTATQANITSIANVTFDNAGSFYVNAQTASASITPSTGHWINVAQVPYGTYQGTVKVTWSGLSAPSSAHHGYMEFDVGSWYGPQYNYGWDSTINVSKFYAHNSFYLDQARLIDAGNELIFQVRASTAVSAGSFSVTVLRGNITSLTPVVDNSQAGAVNTLIQIPAFDGRRIALGTSQNAAINGSLVVYDKVGIGTTPSYKFHLSNSGSTATSFYADIGNPSGNQVLFEHTGSNTPVPFTLRKSGYSGSSKDFGILYLDMAHNITGGGANLHFTLRDSNGAVQEYAGLGGIITTNTSGSYGGALLMYTSNSGGARNERVRISAAGNVGISNTDPQAPLSFANSVGAKIDLYHSGTDRYSLQVQSSELRIHSGAGGDAAGGITLGKGTTSSFTEAMRVRNDTTITIGNSTIAGGAITSNTYTHFERLNSPQTVTRTNWGKSSPMYAEHGRGTPNYSMPFVVSFVTPSNESNSANTYYPVSFNTPQHGGGQFGNFCITRRYYDEGPAQRGGSGIGWTDSSTHQGGMEAWFHLGESAWSDYYSARLLYYRYTYHVTVSDYGMMLTNDSRFGSGPFWVRLRGGFRYWLHSTFPCSPANVTPGGTVFYYPTEGNTYQTWPTAVTSVQNTNFNSQQVWGTL